MKAVILVGGLDIRIGEETLTRPESMVVIGGKPNFRHITKSYPIHVKDYCTLETGYN